MGRPSANANEQAQTIDHTFIPKDVWRRIAKDLGLSPRELEITAGIFDDKTEHAIARELGISKHTVHMHSVRLYQKLGVHSRVGLVLQIISARDTLNGNGHSA